MRAIVVGLLAIGLMGRAVALDAVWVERGRALARRVAETRKCESTTSQMPLDGTDVTEQTCTYDYKGLRVKLALKSRAWEANFTVISLPPIPIGKNKIEITASFIPAEPCFLMVSERMLDDGGKRVTTLAYIDARNGQVFSMNDKPACSH